MTWLRCCGLSSWHAAAYDCCPCVRPPNVLTFLGLVYDVVHMTALSFFVYVFLSSPEEVQSPLLKWSPDGLQSYVMLREFYFVISCASDGKLMMTLLYLFPVTFSFCFEVIRSSFLVSCFWLSYRGSRPSADCLCLCGPSFGNLLLPGPSFLMLSYAVVRQLVIIFLLFYSALLWRDKKRSPTLHPVCILIFLLFVLCRRSILEVSDKIIGPMFVWKSSDHGVVCNISTVISSICLLADSIPCFVQHLWHLLVIGSWICHPTS